MMDGSLLATIAASAGIVVAGVGVIAGMAWLTLPRSEDYFESSMAALLDPTTASGVSPQRPWWAACANTLDDHQPDGGSHGRMESSGSPPPIIGSDRALLSGSDGGRAVQPIPPEGAPVRTIDASPDHVGHGDLATGPAAGVHSGGRASFHSIEGCGVSAPAVRSRQPGVLFLVSK